MKFKIKVGDHEIEVHADGCDVSFDGSTLVVKGKAEIQENHFHYHYPQYNGGFTTYPIPYLDPNIVTTTF